jgi:integrase
VSVFKLRRRKNGKVRVSISYHGRFWNPITAKRVLVSLKTTDKQEARAALEQIKRDVRHEKLGWLPSKSLQAGSHAPLANHLRDYVADLAATGCADKYVYNVGKRIERLSRECSWNVLNDVLADSFQGWRAKQEPKMAAKTRNEYLDAVSALLNWLVRNKRAVANPLKEVRRADTAGKTVRDRAAFTDAEFFRLLDVAEERKVVYLAALYTGLRRGELAALEWADLRLDEEKPYLVARASTTKNGKSAPICLHPDLANALRGLRLTADLQAPVLAGRIPTMTVFRADLEKAGIPFLNGVGERRDFHSLRHTLGTMLAKSGALPWVVKGAMRHSDFSLTERYTDVSQLPTGGAFLGLPSFAPERGPHTQKHTHFPDAGGQNGSPCGTVGESSEVVETIENKGDSHVLAREGAEGPETENGSKGRTRTYKTSIRFSTTGFAGKENQLEKAGHSHLGQLITRVAGLKAANIVWIAERFTEEHRAELDWLNGRRGAR